MGPNLIIDKSFLQSLDRDALFELTLWFRPVCPTVLIAEILADLAKPEASVERVPKDIVMDLAAKMSGSGSLQPVHWRNIALAELCGRTIPMTGQVPVDAKTGNVHVSSRGFMYDAVPLQRLWAAWAHGDFGTDDEEMARGWREGVADINLDALIPAWRPFVDGRLGSPSTLAGLISAIDEMMNTPGPDTQLELLRLALSMAEAPADVLTTALDALYARPSSVLRERAPYVASVARLVLTMVCALPRGFVGPRKSNAIDLLYLYYAPFCAAFASSDKLHRNLWPATTTRARFLWGPEILNELRQRAVIRKGMTNEQWAKYREPYGYHPPSIEGSPINLVWDEYMSVTGSIPPPRAKNIADLEPEVQRQMREFYESIGRPWPHG